MKRFLYLKGTSKPEALFRSDSHGELELHFPQQQV